MIKASSHDGSDFHDVAWKTAAVSDRIAVMRQGELQQVATMPELIDRPATRFMADFVGEPPISIFENVGTCDVRCPIGDNSLALPERLAATSRAVRPLSAGVRPANLAVGSSEAEGISAIARSVQTMRESARSCARRRQATPPRRCGPRRCPARARGSRRCPLRSGCTSSTLPAKTS